MEANEDILRAAYDALNRGDFESVLELLHPQIQWTQGELGPLEKVHGRDSFEAFLHSWLESFDDFRIEPIEVVERGDRLMAVVRQSGRGRGSGVEISVEIAHIWTIESGRAIGFEGHPNREQALLAMAREG